MPTDENICGWCKGHPLLRDYHNGEWGIPLHDDRRQFEYLTLEVMQCGLSWMLILKKRDAIRTALADFDYDRVARFDDGDISSALGVPGMIRSERKVRAVVSNARVFRKIREEHGSFDAWIWSFTEGKTLVYRSHRQQFPAENALSREISAALRKMGMKYLGPVTVYSHLQAAGLINDHEEGCRMYGYVNENFPVRFFE